MNGLFSRFDGHQIVFRQQPVGPDRSGESEFCVLRVASNSNL